MFIDPSPFPFIQKLEAGWQCIRDECLALAQDSFEPWVRREMYGEGWSVYGLIAFGERIEPALKACPRTAELLSGVPGLTTAGFSRMAPGTHIQPHVGWVETVSRLHMGLIVPDGDCALRVADETRPWKLGHCLVFDDTSEHEAWNRAATPRTVLLLDFLRPGMQGSAPDVPPLEVQSFVRQQLKKSN
ncbi:MAG: aspartyl/asparaginyl beta-hydroxylase domain-containing protein [Pseudomonadota bacterium]